MNDDIIKNDEQATTNEITTGSNLYSESNELVNKIINEYDSDKLDELTKLFSLNQRKKDIARVNKLSQLLNLVDDEMANRLIDAPEGFENSDLIKYMSTAQQTMTSIENNLEQKPLIQINNQKNEINITDSGLNRESRQKVIDAVFAILNSNTDNIIDIEIEDDN